MLFNELALTLQEFYSFSHQADTFILFEFYF